MESCRSPLLVSWRNAHHGTRWTRGGIATFGLSAFDQIVSVISEAPPRRCTSCLYGTNRKVDRPVFAADSSGHSNGAECRRFSGRRDWRRCRLEGSWKKSSRPPTRRSMTN